MKHVRARDKKGRYLSNLAVMIQDSLRESELAEAFWTMEELLQQERLAQPCPHGASPAECNACMEQSDFLYDSMREAKWFR